jgi:hypothetical protein
VVDVIGSYYQESQAAVQTDLSAEQTLAQAAASAVASVLPGGKKKR